MVKRSIPFWTFSVVALLIAVAGVFLAGMGSAAWPAGAGVVQITATPITPTPDPSRSAAPRCTTVVVEPGDTLPIIAEKCGYTVDEILSANPIPDPNMLPAGLVLRMPSISVTPGPAHKLIPDSELVYGPTASDFDVMAYIDAQLGLLRAYTETVDGSVWTGPQIVAFVAHTYSVNPRLLLALLEYRGGWLRDPSPPESARTYPLGIVEARREGLFQQLRLAADALNAGYYDWKYRGMTSLVFANGEIIVYADGLNAGTVGVQHMLSQNTSFEQWQRDVGPAGFFQTYLDMFGDPFIRALEPLIPPDLVQPALVLPFGPGEQWIYTGGPHTGYGHGAAWAAIDLTPLDPPGELISSQGMCMISPYWATAAAPGVVARSDDGLVILDLDGDGDEHTGWTLVYMHLDAFERIDAGATVEAGDPLGHPSCASPAYTITTGTHLHFARRYNGEWIPAQCHNCPPDQPSPLMILGEWTVCGYPSREYQGCMTRPGEDGFRQADQSRNYMLNRIDW